ncbi:MAG: aminotransferase class III-fold pyridoxal phosphate-dependent enzyme [Pseudomonadota bacterium]
MSTQQHWIERARAVLPAGGFGNFDPSTVIREGRGARVWDEDGNEYVDYLIGSGPMLLGHSHPDVLQAIQEQLSLGQTFFANNSKGIELAEQICAAVPCAEQLRFVSTGGEADMYAMRLARAFTRRNKILKFEGGYHGMSAEAQMSTFPKNYIDFPLAEADSAGIPESVRDHVLVGPYNDLQYVEDLLQQHGDTLAAIIVEPLQRIVPPAEGFLQGLRALCSHYGALLIFDEVVTGFRFAYGGAQELYGVTPDLCTLGKIIGGGLPLAAVTGRTDVMNHFDKSKVTSELALVQIGTLSGNPLAAAAGLKSLEILRKPGQFEQLTALGKRLMQHIENELGSRGIPHKIVGQESVFDVVFTEQSINNYRDVQAGDVGMAATYNRSLRDSGIFKSPGKMYPSLALTENDIRETEAAISVAADAVANQQ